MKNQSAFLILLAAMLWGTTGTAQTFAPKEASPIVIGAVRIAIGGPALLLLAYVQKKLAWNDWHAASVMAAAIGVALFSRFFSQQCKRPGWRSERLLLLAARPLSLDCLNGYFSKNGRSAIGGLLRCQRLQAACFFC